MGDRERLDGAVLHRLCEAGPMGEDELVREFGKDAEDCIGVLRRRGLVHRLEGGFLIASAAGRHADALSGSWL